MSTQSEDLRGRVSKCALKNSLQVIRLGPATPSEKCTDLEEAV